MADDILTLLSSDDYSLSSFLASVESDESLSDPTKLLAALAAATQEVDGRTSALIHGQFDLLLSRASLAHRLASQTKSTAAALAREATERDGMLHEPTFDRHALEAPAAAATKAVAVRATAAALLPLQTALLAIATAEQQQQQPDSHGDAQSHSDDEHKGASSSSSSSSTTTAARGIDALAVGRALEAAANLPPSVLDISWVEQEVKWLHEEVVPKVLDRIREVLHDGLRDSSVEPVVAALQAATHVHRLESVVTDAFEFTAEPAYRAIEHLISLGIKNARAHHRQQLQRFTSSVNPLSRRMADGSGGAGGSGGSGGSGGGESEEERVFAAFSAALDAASLAFRQQEQLAGILRSRRDAQTRRPLADLVGSTDLSHAASTFWSAWCSNLLHSLDTAAQRDRAGAESLLVPLANDFPRTVKLCQSTVTALGTAQLSDSLIAAIQRFETPYLHRTWKHLSDTASEVFGGDEAVAARPSPSTPNAIVRLCRAIRQHLEGATGGGPRLLVITARACARTLTLIGTQIEAGVIATPDAVKFSTQPTSAQLANAALFNATLQLFMGVDGVCRAVESPETHEALRPVQESMMGLVSLAHQILAPLFAAAERGLMSTLRGITRVDFDVTAANSSSNCSAYAAATRERASRFASGLLSRFTPSLIASKHRNRLSSRLLMQYADLLEEVTVSTAAGRRLLAADCAEVERAIEPLCPVPLRELGKPYARLRRLRSAGAPVAAKATTTTTTTTTTTSSGDTERTAAAS
eukprot:CAMPEP_0170733774 /NCGR_PEP_ID=MMETSP0437-20130122/2246_1 /TAXON_ID=0 /ORGANISM="Sexangularia sp." /LENGTH=755 /DNA_ID=CAMNT_0011072063 /DNA_START=58 /DNA_END=2326 /DNA_ORIENTATION=+